MNMVPFGSICHLQNGRAFKPTDWSETGDPIIRIQNLNDESKPFNYCDFEVEAKFHVYSGDLLFSWSGTPGTSFGAFFWQRGFGVLNQHIFKVTVDDTVVSKEYLRYAINSKLNVIIDQAHGGVGLKHITKGKLEAIEIPLPPLAEQKRIAAILDKADAIRQKRKQAIELADEFLRSVFLEMFGDPVTNPKGWEVKELADVTHKVTDGTHKTPTYTSEGVPFLSAKNIKPWGLDWSDTKFISLEEHKDLVRRCNPEIGDVLLSKSGSLGTPAIVDVDKDFSLFESAALFKLNKEIIEPEYLFHYLNSNPTKYMMLKSTKGVAIKHLHLTDLRRLKILLPPKEFRQRFIKISSLVRSKVEKLHSASWLLDDSFNALSQKAFSGQL